LGYKTRLISGGQIKESDIKQYETRQGVKGEGAYKGCVDGVQYSGDVNECAGPD